MGKIEAIYLQDNSSFSEETIQTGYLLSLDEVEGELMRLHAELTKYGSWEEAPNQLLDQITTGWDILTLLKAREE